MNIDFEFEVITKTIIKAEVSTILLVSRQKWGVLLLPIVG